MTTHEYLEKIWFQGWLGIVGACAIVNTILQFIRFVRDTKERG